MNEVSRGDLVRVHYTTLSGDDCVLETSVQRDPLEFIAGEANVIAGLSTAVIGMRRGDKKRIRIPPEQGFGFRDPRWQQTAPKLGLPDRMASGDQVTCHWTGALFPVWIRGINGDEVTLDANHPLAGETLVIDLELIGIGSTTDEQDRNSSVLTMETTP